MSFVVQLITSKGKARQHKRKRKAARLLFRKKKQAASYTCQLFLETGKLSTLLMIRSFCSITDQTKPEIRHLKWKQEFLDCGLDNLYSTKKQVSTRTNMCLSKERKSKD